MTEVHLPANSENLTLIEVEKLTRVDSSTQQTVLQSVNLTLKERDRIGLGGPSGSGKSSLLRAITCLDPYQSGSVRFRGETLTPEQIPSYRSRVVYLPQRAVIFEGTVRENLAIPFSLQRSEQTYDEEIAIQQLSHFDRNEDFLCKNADTLSGGEQQIIAWIRCFMMNPNVILFDEPTTGLDSEARSKFEDAVDHWFETPCINSKAFIWASHDADQLARLSNRRISMNRGKLEMCLES